MFEANNSGDEEITEGIPAADPAHPSIKIVELFLFVNTSTDANLKRIVSFKRAVVEIVSKIKIKK